MKAKSGARTGVVAVYITASNRAEARRLANALVEERLAACVNILGAIESVYRWKGRVEKGNEVALIAKTRRSRVRALTARVQELHSYEVPCVVVFPLEDGNKAFLSWVASESLGQAAYRG